MPIEDVLKQLAKGGWSKPPQSQSLDPNSPADHKPLPSHHDRVESTPEATSNFSQECAADGSDPYCPYHQAAIKAQERLRDLDWPFGLRVWLKSACPALFETLYVKLPVEIDRTWEPRVPLSEFQSVLDRWVQAHQEAVNLWKSRTEKAAMMNPPRTKGGTRAAQDAQSTLDLQSGSETP